MKNSPYGRIDASRVELPGQQEAFERANQMRYIMEHGTQEQYDELMHSLGLDVESISEGEQDSPTA